MTWLRGAGLFCGATWLIGAASVVGSSCAVNESNVGDPVGAGGSGASSTAVSTGGGNAVGGGGPGPGGAGSGASGGGTHGPDGIACGSAVCSDAMLCCVVGTLASCVGSVDECGGRTAPDVLLFCDDSFECSDGETCCNLGTTANAGVETDCSSRTCPIQEVCTLKNGECAAGYTCVEDLGSATGARCELDDKSVGCGGMPCGPGERCCGDVLVCAPYSDDTDCAVGFECDSAADCGTGYACCGRLGQTWSECRAECPPATHQPLCTTDQDCSGGAMCDDATALGWPGFSACQ
jgi:hypothetical protein